jgi:hypothetical protein
VQGVGVDAAREDLARGRDDGVVGPGQSGDRVEEDDDIPLDLDQALGLLQDDVGDLGVARRRLIEGRGDDLGIDAALEIRDLLGPLGDEQDDEEDLRVVLLDGLGDRLEDGRLAGPRR